MADEKQERETPEKQSDPAPEQTDIGGTDTGDGPESSETSGQFPADEVRETFVPDEPLP